MAMPWEQHGTLLPCRCHDIAMLLPCYGHVIAMLLPYYCHAICHVLHVIGMIWPCYCQADAMIYYHGFCRDIAMTLPP
jgi:hypothetical protein